MRHINISHIRQHFSLINLHRLRTQRHSANTAASSRPQFPQAQFKKLLAGLSVGLLAFAATACSLGDDKGSGETITVTHAQGSTDVPQNPQRIAVLDIGILDSVDFLGGNVVAVPKNALAPFQEKYKDESVTDIGTMQEPDVEKLAAADPDLIIVGSRSAAKYNDVSQVAPTVDLTIDNTKFMDSFKTQAQTLGTIMNKTEQVNERLAEIDQSIASLKTRGSAAKKSLILLTSGGKLSAYGSGSRFSLIHDSLGIPTAVADLKQDRHGQAVSFEFVSQAKPEHLYVIDRDAAIGESGAAAAQVLNNPLVASTPAWKNKKVTYLDGIRWYVLGNGLNNVPEMIKEIEKSLGS